MAQEQKSLLSFILFFLDFSPWFPSLNLAIFFPCCTIFQPIPLISHPSIYPFSTYISYAFIHPFIDTDIHFSPTHPPIWLVSHQFPINVFISHPSIVLSVYSFLYLPIHSFSLSNIPIFLSLSFLRLFLLYLNASFHPIFLSSNNPMSSPTFFLFC